MFESSDNSAPRADGSCAQTKGSGGAGKAWLCNSDKINGCGENGARTGRSQPFPRPAELWKPPKFLPGWHRNPGTAWNRGRHHSAQPPLASKPKRQQMEPTSSAGTRGTGNHRLCGTRVINHPVNDSASGALPAKTTQQPPQQPRPERDSSAPRANCGKAAIKRH